MGTLDLNSDELSISLELNALSEWWYFLYLTLSSLLVGLPLANDLLPLHRLPEPAMAVEVGRGRKHPGNGSALNEADEYTKTIFSVLNGITSVILYVNVLICQRFCFGLN